MLPKPVEKDERQLAVRKIVDLSLMPAMRSLVHLDSAGIVGQGSAVSGRSEPLPVFPGAVLDTYPLQKLNRGNCFRFQHKDRSWQGVSTGFNYC